MVSDELTPQQRAEDILLGSLGFAEDARITHLERRSVGYAGRIIFSDGEETSFESEEETDELQEWALQVLLDNKS